MTGAWLRALERHARLATWLAVVGWLAYIAGAIASGRPFRPGWLFTLFLILVAGGLLAAWVASRRRMAIRERRLPVLAKRKLRQQYPQLEAKDADLVERGFRQFFMACARSDGKYVAMPSKAVDAYWHALILDTRSYAEWCERTLGRFLHHVPAERLGSDAAANDGLRRAWFFACKEEAIDPRKPSRLPLLFALDSKLGIPGGFVYSPRPRPTDARAASGGGGTEITYSEDLGDASFSGDADGMGGADAGGDGGGDGGGCGGGGD
jgi:hypothetical protein